MKLNILCASATAIALALNAAPALAAWHCSIHQPAGASSAQLRSMARISRSSAERIACEHVRHVERISEAEVEAEQECLIWSFDIQQRGRKGVEEINIDAGNGRVLGKHHESAGEEAAEPN